ARLPEGGVIAHPVGCFGEPRRIEFTRMLAAANRAADQPRPLQRFHMLRDGTPEQNEILSLSSALTRELLDADEYVIGVPMHNWGPAASFRLWLDQVVRFGETVAVAPTGTKGALSGKRLTGFVTAGRHYGPNSEDPSHNHLEPWLRTFFSNLGVEDMEFIFVDGAVEVVRGRIAREDFLAPHLAAIAARPLL